MEASVTALTPRLRGGQEGRHLRFLPCLFRNIFAVQQIHYCYTYGLLCAECDITVPRNSLADRAAKINCIKRLIRRCMRYNVPRICATQVCRACGDKTACVAVRSPTLRIGCCKRTDSEGSSSVAGKKTLCRSSISQRSHVGDLRQTIQGKGVIHKRVETAGALPSCAPARRQRTFPRSAERNSSLRFSEKLPARQERTRLRSSSPTVNRCRETTAFLLTQ